MIFDDGMQLLDDEFYVMPQVLSILCSYEMEYFDYDLNL
jgi:hypothetical protein